MINTWEMEFSSARQITNFRKKGISDMTVGDGTANAIDRDGSTAIGRYSSA